MTVSVPGPRDFPREFTAFPPGSPGHYSGGTQRRTTTDYQQRDTTTRSLSYNSITEQTDASRLGYMPEY